MTRFCIVCRREISANEQYNSLASSHWHPGCASKFGTCPYCQKEFQLEKGAELKCYNPVCEKAVPRFRCHLCASYTDEGRLKDGLVYCVSCHKKQEGKVKCMGCEKWFFSSEKLFPRCCDCEEKAKRYYDQDRHAW